MTSRSANDEPTDAVLVGRVLRAHGIRGDLKVEAWSDVDGRFDRGVALRVQPSRGGAEQRRTIERVRGQGGTLLIKFEGVDDRDAADRLHGARLAVDASQVPDPPEGLYYHFQLIGCAVHDRATGLLGRVEEVLEDGGGILLRVDGDHDDLLVPFVHAFVSEVDLDRARIDVDLPVGLIEACTS